MADEAAWQDWAETHSMASRDRLVERYLPLARSVASRLYHGRTDEGVPFDDYLQYARMGLIESVSRFDPSRGAPFFAFAQHRIRGAILNGLTQETELAAQREVARRVARERRESLLAEMPEGVEAVTLDHLIELTVGLALGALLDGVDELADESPHTNPYAATELLQLQTLARAAVQQLPARERDLIQAHYYERREFRDIAQQWALSTGRVSQLHARAIAGLRKLLMAQPRLNRRV